MRRRYNGPVSPSTSGPVKIRDQDTGAYTREFFDEIIARELERARRHHDTLSVLSVLLVNWDEVLAKGGPEAGATAMAEAANVLRTSVRETDLVFRWQADEFVILLVEADLAACAKKVEQFGASFRPWREGNGPVSVPVKFRVGGCTLEEDLVFAGVLQAARTAARERSSERSAFIPPPA
jgi:diguanylate cyclase (GGDEF)-like protein